MSNYLRLTILFIHQEGLVSDWVNDRFGDLLCGLWRKQVSHEGGMLLLTSKGKERNRLLASGIVDRLMSKGQHSTSKPFNVPMDGL